LMPGTALFIFCPRLKINADRAQHRLKTCFSVYSSRIQCAMANTSTRRIPVRLPDDLLAKLRVEAMELERSRNWVILHHLSEALAYRNAGTVGPKAIVIPTPKARRSRTSRSRFQTHAR
jgi:hypothetical protein